MTSSSGRPKRPLLWPWLFAICIFWLLALGLTLGLNQVNARDFGNRQRAGFDSYLEEFGPDSVPALNRKTVEQLWRADSLAGGTDCVVAYRDARFTWAARAKYGDSALEDEAVIIDAFKISLTPDNAGDYRKAGGLLLKSLDFHPEPEKSPFPTFLFLSVGLGGTGLVAVAWLIGFALKRS